MRYFFYGTLMDRSVLAAVIGRSPPAPRHPATLDGYRRVFRAGASYPVLVPSAGEAVSGVVVEGLGEGDARRLDAFEGCDYTRCEMPVRLARGKCVAAGVCMPRPSVAASSLPWSPEVWPPASPAPVPPAGHPQPQAMRRTMHCAFAIFSARQAA